MTDSRKARVELPADDRILITREFDAPRHLVYRAYTTPELVAQWWTAKRGEATVMEIDLRVGGRWRYVMVTPDGQEVGFHGEYREIVENERLVSTEVYEGMPQPEGEPEQGTLNTATFVDRDGGSVLAILVECPSKDVRDAIIASGMEDGLQDALDLLEDVARSQR